MSVYHTPVLLEESLSGLITNTSGLYIDATFGGGGHSAGILSRLSPEGRLIAFDRDSDAIANKPDDPRITLIHANFRYIYNFLLYRAWQETGSASGMQGADGILADLGVSSHQFDTAERGFSFRFDAPLDMRMNKEASSTAADIVNDSPVAELVTIFRLYGEVDNAARMAELIDKARSNGRIATTFDLNKVLEPALPTFASHKTLAKVYQALRIEVNHEMRSLEKFLDGTVRSLKEGGRIAVITYHSLEDRMVKNFFRSGNIRGDVEKDSFGCPVVPFKAVTRKPILPQENEISANTRARSAKLRIAERIGNGKEDRL